MPCLALLDMMGGLQRGHSPQVHIDPNSKYWRLDVQYGYCVGRTRCPALLHTVPTIHINHKTRHLREPHTRLVKTSVATLPVLGYEVWNVDSLR